MFIGTETHEWDGENTFSMSFFIFSIRTWKVRRSSRRHFSSDFELGNIVIVVQCTTIVRAWIYFPDEHGQFLVSKVSEHKVDRNNVTIMALFSHRGEKFWRAYFVRVMDTTYLIVVD